MSLTGRNSDQKSREVLKQVPQIVPVAGQAPASCTDHLGSSPFSPTLGMRLALWESWNPNHPSQGLLSVPQAALLWQEGAGGQRIFSFPLAKEAWASKPQAERARRQLNEGTRLLPEGPGLPSPPNSTCQTETAAPTSVPPESLCASDDFTPTSNLNS